MSAMSSNTTDSQRFSPISEFDHAGILWITTLLAGIYFVLSIFTRIYIKYFKWWHDDWVCIVATVSSLPLLFLLTLLMRISFLGYRDWFGQSDLRWLIKRAR